MCSVGMVWGQRALQRKLSALLAEIHAVVVLIQAQTRPRSSMDNGDYAGTTFLIHSVTTSARWCQTAVSHCYHRTGCNNTLADANTLFLVQETAEDLPQAVW